MDSNLIYQVLLDQREELKTNIGKDFVYRREVDMISLSEKLAQVVIGVRRSGKSTLCHMALQKAGVKYAYVNFDDDRLANLQIQDLNLVLESLYRVYGNEIKYILFDEIQNTPGWHLFVNRLLRQGLHLLVTGSNAHLLSSELSTHLTGRYREIRLYPFSFEDYCKSRQIDIDTPTTKNVALIKNTLDNYLMEGGFPEITSLSDRRGYVGALINAIITKDIMPRFRIRNEAGLKTLANHLINNSAQIVDKKELVESLEIGSDKTITNYLDYLHQAFLIIPLTKFSYKSQERLRNSKAYVVDTGMLTYRPNQLATENLGWRLENVVLLELHRRNYPLNQDVFYYRPSSRDREIDFLISDRGKIIELIQVSYDINNSKTLDRELKSLVEGSKKTGCENLTLIACTETRKIVYDNKEVNIISAIEWLLRFR